MPMMALILFAELIFISGLLIGGWSNPLHVRKRQPKRRGGRFS